MPMRCLINVIIFFLICPIVNAQDLARTREIISAVIGADNITYQDSVSKGVIMSMRESIQRYRASTFYKFRDDSVIYSDGFGIKIISVSNSRRFSNNHIRYIKLDSIKLSETEIKYIDTKIAEMHRYKWNKELFPNAILIPTDTITKIFGDWRKYGWAYLNKKHIDKLYNFAPPIFLRDDTYCLFYYGYGCGDLCGQGEFALYKKENGKWVKWFSLFESIS